MKGEQGSKQTHIQQQQHRSQDQSSASTWEDQWCQTTEGHNISPYLGAWIPSFTVTQCGSMHEPGEVQQRNSSPDATLHEGETNPQIPVPKEPETSNPPTTTWSQEVGHQPKPKTTVHTGRGRPLPGTFFCDHPRTNPLPRNHPLLRGCTTEWQMPSGWQ